MTLEPLTSGFLSENVRAHKIALDEVITDPFRMRNTPSQEIDRDPFHTPDWVRRDFRATYERILSENVRAHKIALDEVITDPFRMRNTPSQEIDRDPFHTPDWVRCDIRATNERILSENARAHKLALDEVIADPFGVLHGRV